MTHLTQNVHFRHVLAAVGAFAALTVATAAFGATPAVDSPSLSVRYGDLDLSTINGVNTLYHRISIAAHRVCPGTYSRELGVVQSARRCQAQAVAKAVTDIGNPQLAMVHASHAAHG